ncbi:MAG: hypothetical protein FD131_4941 [Rhodocyclaceae bacterium]|nr:MAG: hypothetical protein FD131_4941 [Rhodocyclaceae bacterium]
MSVQLRKIHLPRASALAIGLLFGQIAQVHAVSYTINGITVSSNDSGFSQPSANTIYFPTGGADVTTFTFADGKGFTISNSEASGGSSSENIAGLPTGGGINAIAGFGYNSTVTVRDAINSTQLFSGNYRALTGSSWFAPGLNFSYAGGTLTVNAIGDVQQINADGTVTYIGAAGAPILIGNYVLFSAGPSAADTQVALLQTAHKLRNVFNASAIASNFANMNTYECNLFDTNGVCVSLGGRYTSVNSPNSETTNGVLVLGYKATQNIRIGAFVDESVSNNSPTGIQVNNRLSYVGELSYAFNYGTSTLLRPYLAVRYTNIQQEGYTETGVSTPLNFTALNDRSTSALLGVKVNHHLAPKINLTGSLGIEQDLEHKVDNLAASGIAGLTSESFDNSINRTRPVASVGAYYEVAKGQRLSAEIYYQELAFQRTGSTTAYINYMVGF